MAQDKLRVARNGVVVGDFTKKEIRDRIATGMLLYTDDFWDTRRKKWVRLSREILEESRRESDRETPNDDETDAPFERLFNGVPFWKIPSEFFKIKWSKLPWGTYPARLALALVVICAVALLKRPDLVLKKAGDLFGPDKPALSARKTETHYPRPQAPRPTEPRSVDKDGRAPDFEPYSRYNEELFASRALCMAGMSLESDYVKRPGEAPRYGISGSIGVIVRNVRKGERYTVEFSADRLIGKTTGTFVIREDAPAVLMCPRPNYDFSNLRRNIQSSFINVTFKVLREDEVEGPTQTRRWLVRQINDCPLTLKHTILLENGQLAANDFDEAHVIAGYVNENHPWIDTILLEAKDTGICTEFIGYQGGVERIWPQVAAIWKALQNRNLTYSSIATSTSSGTHTLQHVRFLDQSISSTQANCLDGSVLLSSVLRKIDLNVSIVLVPGHAYVCVLDATNTKLLMGIETTMLGKTDLNQAVREATMNSKFSLSKLSKRTRSNYDFVNIADLRKDGIQPIPFDAIAAIPSRPPYNAVVENQSPEEVARQQRIMIANRLRQKVVELQASINSRTDESYRIEAFNLFNEIRKHQSAFNSLSRKPGILPSGVQSADDEMVSRYSQIIATLRTRSIPVDTEVKASDLESAKVLADALLGLSSLPLNY